VELGKFGALGSQAAQLARLDLHHQLMAEDVISAQMGNTQRQAIPLVQIVLEAWFHQQTVETARLATLATLSHGTRQSVQHVRGIRNRTLSRQCAFHAMTVSSPFLVRCAMLAQDFK